MAATFAEAVGVGAGTVVRLRLSKALRKLRLAVIRLPGSAPCTPVLFVGKQSLGLGPGIESGFSPSLSAFGRRKAAVGVTSGSCYVKQCSGSPLPSPASSAPHPSASRRARRPRKGKTCPGEGPSTEPGPCRRITMCAWASRARVQGEGRRRGPPPLLRGGDRFRGGGTPPPLPLPKVQFAA